MNLPAIATPNQHLALLSLDIVPRLAAQFGLDLTVKANEIALHQLLQEMARTIVPAMSGVVLDPIYSYDLMVRDLDHAGLFLNLEKLTAEIEPQNPPTLIPNWGVDRIKQHYAWAKLELIYHPNEPAALTKKQLVAELGDFCRHEGIGFLLKLKVPSLNSNQSLAQAAQFQQDQLTAAQELVKSVSLLALENPQDALACATLTAELDVPWIIALEPTLDYEKVKEILRMSLENGAQGFLVAEALWSEIYQLRASDSHSPDWVKIREFLATTARDRSIELARIADEAGI